MSILQVLLFFHMWLASIKLFQKTLSRISVENGTLTSRQQLKKVPRLGDKAFEQAGFLRIPDGNKLFGQYWRAPRVI